MVKEDAYADPGTSVRSRLAGLQRHQSSLVFQARPLPLHAMISAVGWAVQHGEPYDWHGLKRGDAEFVLVQYTIAGEGRLTWQGVTRPVRPGEAMLLHFPHDNRYWLPPGGTWEHCYLCLHGREINRAWRELLRRRGPLVPLSPGSKALRTMVETVRTVLAGEVVNPFIASALAYAVAMDLLAELCGDATGPAPSPGIRRAIAWAQERHRTAVGVEDLARIAGLSRHHFSRRFAAATGSSPAAFVADLRIRSAAALLRDGVPVKEAARACGFNDAAYFCRAFRRTVGVSPGAFRSSGMY